MKQFLAIFTGNPTSMRNWMAEDEEARKQKTQQGVRAWNAWVEQHRHAIVEMGAPVGKTKRIGRDGVSDITNNIGAYNVVQAESYDAAAAMFVNHPHFTLFPGDAVEIMECLPIPQAN